MQFLSAVLLGGLALAAVPLIIHLLNRRRFQLVEWAPMKYLRLTIRNNRRRMRIEQLLLLLLRTLLVVLLVLTIARPVLSRDRAASWLARRSRVSRVIVLDDSLSTGYRHDGRTALEDGKAAVAELLHATGAQDAVTLLTTAPGAAPLVREASVDDPGRLLAKVDALRPTDAACNWAATFKTVDDCLSTAAFPQKELILVTDLRRAGWAGNVREIAGRWAAQGVSVRVIDVGSRETADVALVRFAQEDPLVLPGQSARLTASVRNGTPAAIAGAQAVLMVDGKPQPILLPDLPPGQVIDVPMSVTLDAPGPHTLKLTLPDDALAGDNVRYLSIDVRERLDVTIVDGRQGSGPFESAGDFLHLALTAGADPWRVQRLGDADPQAGRPDAATDVIALADVATLTDAAVAAYEQRVRDGVGLMIFVGEQVDADAYNDRLYRNGAGLLPARLTRVVDGPVRGIVVEPFADSPLAPLAKLLPVSLAKIQAKRVMGAEVPPPHPTNKGGADAPPTVRVLARWNDAEGHPAVIEKRLGRGRVLLWTLSADREWSDWPVDPTYVLAMRSAAVAIARPDRADHNLAAGQPIELAPPEGGPALNPRATSPDDPGPQPIAADGSLMRVVHTERAGTYTLSWDDAAARRQSRQVCVSFDRAASDLEPITPAELASRLGSLKAEILPYRRGFLSPAGGGREVWRMIASILAALFVIETGMAYWVGRER